MPLDIGVYVPQMGFEYPDLRHRARRCEELGIGSLWLYDHLYGPGLPDVPSLEAWTLATALLTDTERLRVGHMVLCNQFRHPVLLAKMATTLDQISGGRLALGLGSGSIEPGGPWLPIARGMTTPIWDSCCRVDCAIAPMARRPSAPRSFTRCPWST